MTRRTVILLLPVLLAACGSGDAVPLNSDTMRKAGDWKLVESGAAADRWSGRYEGSPEIRVTLTRMSSQTVAFSAVQSWRAEPGKLAFYQGRYFGVAESPGADQRTLSRFVTAFEKLLPQ